MTSLLCATGLFELPTFTADAKAIWAEDERGAFCAWLAKNPMAGDVIPGSGGCRKVRWARAGIGKAGGVPVIYFSRLESGVICLMVIYAKAVRGNIPAHLLKAIKEAVQHGDQGIHDGRGIGAQAAGRSA